MSEENSPSPEASAATKPAPRVRRISNPRPKKTAAGKKAAPETEAAVEAPVAPVVEAPAPKPAAPAAKAAAPAPAPEEDSAEHQDWPDSETAPETSGGNAPGEGNKRKRRRRKGKGGQNASAQNGNVNGNGHEEIHQISEQLPQQQQPAPSRPAFQAPQHAQQHQHHPQQSQNNSPRNSANPEVLAKKAWKIFLAEVSEEGVALISDHDARELSKRCFRLAEIFIEEQGRKLR